MKLLTYIMISAMLVLSIACSSSSSIDDVEYTPPTVKYQPRLIYPTTAQENFWEGKPIVLVDISEKGTVLETHVVRSSGYKELDNAAEDYCQNILFKPAMMKEKPLHSRLKIGVDFKLDDHQYSPKKYVHEVNTLYKLIPASSQNLSLIYKNQIFTKHNDFVYNLKDALNFNYYLSNVIDEYIANEWDTVWNSWPLSFLVFHDFLTRFPEYPDSAKVKTRLCSALSEDVKYIIKTQSSTGDKLLLLNKISSFMKKEYPELDIDDINFDVNKIEQPNI